MVVVVVGGGGEKSFSTTTRVCVRVVFQYHPSGRNTILQHTTEKYLRDDIVIKASDLSYSVYIYIYIIY